MANNEKYAESFNLYKPKKNGDGAASQWDLGSNRQNIFLVIAEQKRDSEKPSFDWDNKITMKLGPNDIGEILAVLANLQESVGPKDSDGKGKGLYHQTDKGNTILQLAKMKDGKGYAIRISQKLKNKKEARILQHFITVAEGCVLETLLRRGVEVIYRWK
jgi:hypothetical protein